MWFVTGLAGAAGLTIAGLIAPKALIVSPWVNAIVGFVAGVLGWQFHGKKRMAQLKDSQKSK